MVGAVQLCALAALIVLFVPMAMAGWHMSPKRMLFCSMALFITLSIGVHLSPYFIPSIAILKTSFSSPIFVDNRDSCISLLHDIVWDVQPILLPNGSLQYLESWNWEESSPVSGCGFQKLSRADTSDLLNGSWVLVAGDSQARLAALSLLDLVLDSESMESARSDLFKRHGNYHTVVDAIGMQLDFVWAPHVSNLTNLMIKMKYNNYPDVLIMGCGLWHMLHMNNASDYGISFESLKSSVLPFSIEFRREGSVTVRSQHLFWLGLPNLVNSMLNTEEKRMKMTDEMVTAYDLELHQSKILRQYGGPLLLLDMESLSRVCGSKCTEDGMHYNEEVYDAAIHIMLNALLIESHQKL